MPDRELIEDAGVVLACLALLELLAVFQVVQGTGKSHARKQDRLAVRAPQRPQCAGCDLCDTLGLAAACDVEYVDLWFVLAVALGGESDSSRIRAPFGVRLGTGRESQSSRRRTAVRRHEPQVAGFRIVVVGGLRDRDDDEAPVGGKRGRADALHEPDILVSDRMFRSVFGRCRGRGEAQQDEQAFRFHVLPQERHWRAQTFCSSQGWSGTSFSLNSSPRPWSGVQSVYAPTREPR